MFELALIDNTRKSGLANGGWKYDAYPEIESLEANSTITIADLKGPGVVTCIHITQLWGAIEGPDRRKIAARGVILEMYWDDVETPAVRVPIADFFADGLGGAAKNFSSKFLEKVPHAYNCYIPMPFAKSAKIKLVNENDIPLKCYTFVEYETLPAWNENYGYFHATWSRSLETLHHDNCLHALHIDGEGQFIGRAYSIRTREPLFKGFAFICEANNEIRIDGAERPTIDYLGTEDAFGFSWSFREEFCGPLCGMNKILFDGNNAHLSIYRFLDTNKIRFSKSFDLRINWAYEWTTRTDFQNELKAAIAAGGAKVDYAMTHYWYQRHIGFPHADMQPLADRLK